MKRAIAIRRGEGYGRKEIEAKAGFSRRTENRGEGNENEKERKLRKR